MGLEIRGQLAPPGPTGRRHGRLAQSLLRGQLVEPLTTPEAGPSPTRANWSTASANHAGRGQLVRGQLVHTLTQASWSAAEWMHPLRSPTGANWPVQIGTPRPTGSSSLTTGGSTGRASKVWEAPTSSQFKANWPTGPVVDTFSSQTSLSYAGKSPSVSRFLFTSAAKSPPSALAGQLVDVFEGPTGRRVGLPTCKPTLPSSPPSSFHLRSCLVT